MLPQKVAALTDDERVPARPIGVLERLRARLPAAARIGSFADQGFQGFGNIAANALLGRGLSHEQFATIGVMIGVHYFAWGIHRSNVVLPMIINASAAGVSSEDEDAWWWINLISVVMIALVLGVAALLYALIDPNPADRWLQHAVAYAAFVSPALCSTEFARRRLYQRGRGVAAAAASAVSATVLLAVAVWVWRGADSALIGSGGWALGGMAGTALAWAAAPPGRIGFAKIADVWRRHQHFAFWQTMTAIPYAFYTTINVILVAAFAGPAAAAAFTASRTLINPAMAVVSAIDTLDKPRAARALFKDGLAGLHRSIRRTLLTVIGLTGPYLALLSLFSGFVLHLVFGQTFMPYALGVSILSVAAIFACLNQAPETALIVLKAGRAMFAVRLFAAVFTVVSMWLGARWFGFNGCAWALLATNLINFSLLRIVSTRISRDWAAP
jgi:O-antigen/teichoic acid export membrane protein